MDKIIFMKKPEKLMSVPEVAAATGVTRWLVWQLIHAGVVPASKVGSQWCCPPEAVQAVRNRPGRRGKNVGKGKS